MICEWVETCIVCFCPVYYCVQVMSTDTHVQLHALVHDTQCADNTRQQTCRLRVRQHIRISTLHQGGGIQPFFSDFRIGQIAVDQVYFYEFNSKKLAKSTARVSHTRQSFHCQKSTTGTLKMILFIFVNTFLPCFKGQLPKRNFEIKLY